MATILATVEALDKSIAKWQKNAALTDLNDASTGWEDCALCLLFHEKKIGEEGFEGCGSCPVYEQTGFTYCENTPYDEASQAESNCDLGGFVEHSKREVEFLQEVRQNFIDSSKES